MKYTRVLGYIQETPWAILPAKMQEILSVLAMRARGDVFTPEEIAARLGGADALAERRREEPSPQAGGAIAVVPLRGVIAHRIGAMQESSGGISAERFAAMVQTAANDPAVGAILIDVDSPGGTVNGVMDAAAAVYEARDRKPVVAIANGFMASAAYWIGSQAHEVVAVPGLLEASIGSIGVYGVHQDLTEALEKEGIKVTVLTAGKHKGDGLPFQPLSDEHRAFLQGTVDAAYAQFTKDVARGRGVSVADVRGGYGEGRALSARDAKAAGLVDRIATVEDTLARLANPTTRARIGGANATVDDAATAVIPIDGDLDGDARRRYERF